MLVTMFLAQVPTNLVQVTMISAQATTVLAQVPTNLVQVTMISAQATTVLAQVPKKGCYLRHGKNAKG